MYNLDVNAVLEKHEQGDSDWIESDEGIKAIREIGATFKVLIENINSIFNPSDIRKMRRRNMYYRRYARHGKK